MRLQAAPLRVVVTSIASTAALSPWQPSVAQPTTPRASDHERWSPSPSSTTAPASLRAVTVATTAREEAARFGEVRRRGGSTVDAEDGGGGGGGGFYSKSLSCRGVPVRAHASVRDVALVIACERLQRMLRHARPEVAANLIAAHIEVHIIGERQVPGIAVLSSVLVLAPSRLALRSSPPEASPHSAAPHASRRL
jgi:hypothetical protein